jgi:hypothetical protein
MEKYYHGNEMDHESHEDDLTTKGTKDAKKQSPDTPPSGRQSY